MPQKAIIKQGRFIAVLIALLLFFGTAATLALMGQQHIQAMDTHEQEAKNNLAFLSKIVKRAYLDRNYTLVEKILKQWLNDNQNTKSIQAVAANDFELAHYEKEIKTNDLREISRDIVDKNNRLLLRLIIKHSFSVQQDAYTAIRNKFIFGVSLFAGLLGIAFWYANKNMIIAPLEKEISHRLRAESELKILNEKLDERVAQRTIEIREKNGELKHLIDEREMTAEQMQKLSSAVEQSGDIVLITDGNGIIEYVNPAFENITGYSSNEAIGKSPSIVKSGMHEDDFYSNLWKIIKSGESYSDVFINRKKDGNLYYEQRTISPIKNKQGSVINYLATGKDITEHVKDQERLQFMATHDALTGLANWSMLKDRLNHALSQAERNHTKVAVMFLDLDRFKYINDSLGHPVGDKLLKLCSERLSSCVRKGDTLARLGGDEFTIVMESVNDLANIGQIAQKIISSLSEPYIIDGYEVMTSTSMGIALYPEDADNTDTLLKNADAAMYRAKALGGDSYEYYKEDMTRHAVRRLELQNQLIHAMENNEFMVYYQPRINLTTGGVDGMEALLRWDNPKFGKVMPDEFIPILEESDLIIEVGNWVIEQACKFNQTLKSRGLNPVRVSINLSTRQFRGKATLDCIKQLSNHCCSISKCLEIEITETLLMENIDMAARLLKQLSSLGIFIAVDDFGTGYSSMNYLKSFPIDALKIDRSFIKDVPDDSNCAAITKAIIALAHSLEIGVIAEGIETEGQLSFLRKNKCDEAQGFFISHPLPEKEFTKWLSENQNTWLEPPAA
jgi:diguanylate cyclase (GGDEF)-like protein/PAS domain S-box-containing protein